MRLGEVWFLRVKADVARPLTGDHVAFLVSPSTLHRVADRLIAIGHQYQWARSDTALYFSDFDNHVFALDSVGVAYDQRPAAALGAGRHALARVHSSDRNTRRRARWGLLAPHGSQAAEPVAAVSQ